LANGELEFIGRVDNQVKIRGFRIELGEIEQRLQGIEGMQSAAVNIYQNDSGAQQLVAYVVQDRDLTADAEDETQVIGRKQKLIHQYRDQLASSLPEYAVPLIYLFLDQMPLSNNGKLNRGALPAPVESDLIKSRYVAPRNSVEQKLCELWQTVLQLEQVGIEDDFFLLGGHSLLATRLVNLIREALGIELSLSMLFEYTTISDFCAQIIDDIQGLEGIETDSDDFEEGLL
jgi:acyl carrier protein